MTEADFSPAATKMANLTEVIAKIMMRMVVDALKTLSRARLMVRKEKTTVETADFLKAKLTIRSRITKMRTEAEISLISISDLN